MRIGYKNWFLVSIWRKPRLAEKDRAWRGRPWFYTEKWTDGHLHGICVGVLLPYVGLPWVALQPFGNQFLFLRVGSTGWHQVGGGAAYFTEFEIGLSLPKRLARHWPKRGATESVAFRTRILLW